MKVQLICAFLVIATAVAVTFPKEDIFAFAKGSQEDCNVCLFEFTQILQGDKLQWLASLVVPLICATTGLLQDKCLKFLDHYVDLAINVTIALGPEGICERIGSCNKTALTEAFVRQANVNNFQAKYLQHRAAGVGSAEGCNVCKYEFTQILAKDKLQWVTKLVIPLACSITGPVAPKCEAFLNKYADEFINMTIALGPEGICEDLGSCPKPSAAPPTKVPANAQLVDVEATTYNSNCGGCKLGVAYLQAFLNSRDALTQFKALFDNGACKKMPESLDTICETLINTILPSVVSILSENMTPDDICKGVC